MTKKIIGNTVGTTMNPQTVNLNFYPIASLYVTSTNENPSSYLGGEWELVDKHLKHELYTSNNVEGLISGIGEYCASVSITTLITEGHRIHLEFNFKMKNDWKETNETVCTIDFSKFGCSRVSGTPYFLGTGDSVNGVAYLNMTTTGTIATRDFIGRGDVSLPANTTVYVQTELVTSCEYMDDSFCDKFFWKRIG